MLTDGSSGETTELLLKLLHTLVSTPEGAKAFVEVGDVSSLAEIAPTHATVLEIFSFAWLNGMAFIVDKHVLISQVADTMQSLVASFTGTDGVTLLEFLGNFLRQVDPAVSTCCSQLELDVRKRCLTYFCRYCRINRSGSRQLSDSSEIS